MYVCVYAYNPIYIYMYIYIYIYMHTYNTHTYVYLPGVSAAANLRTEICVFWKFDLSFRKFLEFRDLCFLEVRLEFSEVSRVSRFVFFGLEFRDLYFPDLSFEICVFWKFDSNRLEFSEPESRRKITHKFESAHLDSTNLSSEVDRTPTQSRLTQESGRTLEAAARFSALFEGSSMFLSAQSESAQ